VLYRSLRASDAFPDALDTGFERMPVMKNWVWVAEENGETLAVLLAAPMHGLVYMMVLRARENCANGILLGLFRQFFKDCVKRGYKGFWFHINPTKTIERRFIPMIRRMGGTQHIDAQTMLSCELSVAARY